MSEDLIRRSDVLNLATCITKPTYDSPYCESVVYVEDIEAIPSVDVESVRHGEWKPFYEVMEVFTDIYLNTEEREVQTGWECSVCGRYSPKDPAEMPYCHCGAKMHKGVQND